jgi:phage I-like protein
MNVLIATHSVALPGDGQAPDWVHLIPAGRFTGVDGRGPYSLKDVDAVLATSAPAGIDPVIDYDHQTDLAAVKGVGGTAPAAGWVKEFEARADGIWGRVEWTARAAAAIAAREYRYISPVFQHTKSGEVLKVLRAGLTNNPNLQLTALASQETDLSKLKPEGVPMEELLKELAGAFGLPEDSDRKAVVAHATQLVAGSSAQATAIAAMAKAAGAKEDAAPDAVVTAVQAAITKAPAEVVPDPEKFVPAEVVTSLQAQVRELMGDKTTQVVDQAIKDGKVPPANRDWAIAYHSKDPEGFAKFLGGQPAIVTAGAAPGGKIDGEGPLDADDLAMCSAMGIDPEEFKKTRQKEVR